MQTKYLLFQEEVSPLTPLLPREERKRARGLAVTKLHAFVVIPIKEEVQ
jgi:hypothetical protein